MSEHANEPLPTSHFQILKHLRGEGQNFLDWKVPWWGLDGSFLSLGQKQDGYFLTPSWRLEVWTEQDTRLSLGSWVQQSRNAPNPGSAEPAPTRS